MEPCFGGKLPEDLDHRCPKTGVPPKWRQTDNNRQTDGQGPIGVRSVQNNQRSAPRFARRFAQSFDAPHSFNLTGGKRVPDAIIRTPPI